MWNRNQPIRYNFNPAVRANTNRTGPITRVDFLDLAGQLELPPFIDDVYTYENAASSQYDGLSVQLEKRFANLWSARASYSLGYARGNTSGLPTAVNDFQVLEDPKLELNDGPTSAPDSASRTRGPDDMLNAHAILGLIIALMAQQPQPRPAPAPSPPDGLDFEVYRTRIQPIFLAKRTGLVRCVQCHGRGSGGSGLALQPLGGAIDWNDEQTRKNFEAVRRWVVAGDPDASRLLMHPLARSAGGDPFHGGGKHWASKQEPEWVALAAWVKAAARQTATAVLDFEMYRSKIEPIFAREREGPAGKVSCAGCHSGIATQLRLAALPPHGATWSVEQSRQNFAAASQAVVAGEPAKSRLLVHPLAADAGGDPSHTGGKFWKTQDDPEWQALAAWVRTATPGAVSSAPALDFEFFKTRVQPMFVAKREGLVRCVQCHGRGGGSGFPISPVAEGSSTWTDEQARKNFQSASNMVVPGDPTASRLLMHPLARSAGGDPFHGGGKHWSSQADPEWQTLAAWVRGTTNTSR